MDLKLFKAKIWLVFMLGGVSMLLSLFYMNIKQQNRYDEIFENYEIEMNKIHNNIY